MARTYITSRRTESEAGALAVELVARLRARGLLPSHRIAIEPHRPGPHYGWVWWLVLVTDDPEETETSSESEGV